MTSLTSLTPFLNPFRPGAGHMPPYLAGRHAETLEFEVLLEQDPILQNVILTGLRGVGKTVLLETFKPVAVKHRWRWVGADLSESTSISEEHLVTRLLTDLAPITSSLSVESDAGKAVGFGSQPSKNEHALNFEVLTAIFNKTTGLTADKLKRTLELAWQSLHADDPQIPGLIFAYDEAQNLADHAEKEQYPLSLLLDVFQSLQRKGVKFMLVLAGLPTLFPKLVEARTFAERMFRVILLKQLSKLDSREAIQRPIRDAQCPVKLDHHSVETIADISGGYPYFIQFVCREVYDVFLQKSSRGEPPSIPIADIHRKLDTDFFAGRWARATDRQRDLLVVIAQIESDDDEFTVQEIVEKARQELEKPFSASHVSQMLVSLANNGLIYKNRHGKYSFAVPLLGQFILRQIKNS